MPERFIRLPVVPSGEVAGEVRLRCPGCREHVALKDLRNQAMVCPWCDFHFPLEAGARLPLLVDRGSFRALESHPDSSLILGWATILGRPLALALGDPATTWTVEEAHALIRLTEEARLKHRSLLWIVTAAYGTAGALSWPGVQVALSHLQEADLPWIALLAGPCYGPVSTLALQADLVLAEPGTVLSLHLPEELRQAGRLPVESTRSPRRLLGQGWADMVLSRQKQRLAVAHLLDLLGVEGSALPVPEEPRGRLDAPWPPLEALNHLCAPVLELHGDRCCGDDLALVGALARLRSDGTPLLVLVTAQGQGWHKVRQRHGGAIAASGWRKASRLLRLAARFELAVVTLVGSPQPRLARQERPATLSSALGETLRTLLSLPVPTVAVRLDSGVGPAAMALSAADRVLAIAPPTGTLGQEGLRPDGTFGDIPALLTALSFQLRDLRQTYAVHGPLGRRKLLQQRYTRWTRMALLGPPAAGN